MDLVIGPLDMEENEFIVTAGPMVSLLEPEFSLLQEAK